MNKFWLVAAQQAAYDRVSEKVLNSLLQNAVARSFIITCVSCFLGLYKGRSRREETARKEGRKRRGRRKPHPGLISEGSFRSSVHPLSCCQREWVRDQGLWVSPRFCSAVPSLWTEKCESTLSSFQRSSLCLLLKWKPSVSLPGLPRCQRTHLPPQCGRQKRHEFDPWVGKIPWRRAWQPILVFLPRESWTWLKRLHACTWAFLWSPLTACTCSSCCCLVAKLCPTLLQPMDCSLPGSSIHGIF